MHNARIILPVTIRVTASRLDVEDVILHSLIPSPGTESMPMLHIYVCRIVSTFESLVARTLAPGSCITRGRQVARFRSAETIVSTGARLCARRASLYEIVYGTEWYETVRNETETKYFHCIRAHIWPPFSCTTTSSVLRLLQICKREPCFSFVDL